MRRRDPHIFDEQYDGVLSAMALSGGVATVEQLGAWLGGATPARALLQTATERRLGSRIALPGARALALRRTTMRLLAGRESPRPVLARTRFTAIHRFEYHLREGRPLHPTGWVEPALFARGGLRHPEVADAMWASIERIDSVFVDLAPDGSRMALVDRAFAARHFRRLFDALGIVSGLVGRGIDLRIICGSPLHAARVEATLDEMTGPTPGVTWTLLEYDIARAFAQPALADDDSPTAPIAALAPECAEAAETLPG